MSVQIVSPGEVAARGEWLLLDVRLPEDFECGRLPGAKSNCVFEVAFGKRMGELLPDKSAAVCVYGADGQSHESRMAAEKLRRAGYTRVMEMRDGLEAWRAVGHPVEGDGVETISASIPDGTRPVDLRESRVEWTGRNLLNSHRGSVALKSGVLEFRGGRLTGGEFAIDLASIACDDLRGNVLHDVLIAHLRSDDFFDVEKFPEARFAITQADFAPETSGAPNLNIEGLLTIKDATLPLAFAATAGVTAEGKLAAQAVVAFDRTAWNVLYGSGKFFRNLGGHLVNDLIELQLRIVTE